jgi:hypothetical protein
MMLKALGFQVTDGGDTLYLRPEEVDTDLIEQAQTRAATKF